jgi:RNA polymerase sigma-70 factor (ECF subfamily)
LNYGAGTAAESGDALAVLILRMASGDQEALAHLYDETSPLINGLLLRMLRDASDAEEALLDVYMKAWKYAPTYSAERGSVKPWLVMMARGIAIDRIRRRRAQLPPDVGEGREEASRNASPEQQTIESERRGAVGRVLQELPGDQREVLLMAFFSGYTHTELASRLGQPLGTIKTRIRTALIRLRDIMATPA